MCGRPLESNVASLATLAFLIIFRIGPEMVCGLRDMPISPIRRHLDDRGVVYSQAINRAYLSRTTRISSRVRSGIIRNERCIAASRYSARILPSGSGANTLIDSVEKSRPAADAARRSRETASLPLKPDLASGNQPSQNSTTRFTV